MISEDAVRYSEVRLGCLWSYIVVQVSHMSTLPGGTETRSTKFFRSGCFLLAICDAGIQSKLAKHASNTEPQYKSKSALCLYQLSTLLCCQVFDVSVQQGDARTELNSWLFRTRQQANLLPISCAFSSPHCFIRSMTEESRPTTDLAKGFFENFLAVHSAELGFCCN